jgi:hypothetical protein
MDEYKCLRILMNPSCPIERKAEELAEYLLWYKALGRNTGVPVSHSMSLAFRLLFESLPKGDKKAKSKLRSTLEAIQEYSEQIRAEKSAKKTEIAKELCTLLPGTPIRISYSGQLKTVTFLEFKRTRFIFEDSDGLRFSIPADAFMGIAAGKKLKRVSENVRYKRELVRALVGHSSAQARKEILNSGIVMLDCLLGELKAAMRRIEDASSGLSSGVFRNSLGVIKKVNPRDEALVKRIPALVAELAKKNGINRVKKLVEQCSNAEVKELVNEAITKAK